MVQKPIACIVSLGANNRAPALKRLRAYTRIETDSRTIVTGLYLRINVLLAHGGHQQFWLVALCPFLQQFAGRVERQARGAGKQVVHDDF